MAKRLIILHCFGGTPDQNWYRSLAGGLADRFKVVIPALPSPELGKLSEWLPALNALQPDSETILVGHSLGGTLILRYLEQASAPIAAFFLVAAPLNDLARNNLHETGFFERDFDWSSIRQNSKQRFVVAARDDSTVPFWQAEYLAKQLQAKLIAFDNQGHFKAAEQPELVALIRSDHEG